MEKIKIDDFLNPYLPGHLEVSDGVEEMKIKHVKSAIKEIINVVIDECDRTIKNIPIDHKNTADLDQTGCDHEGSVFDLLHEEEVSDLILKMKDRIDYE